MKTLATWTLAAALFSSLPVSAQETPPAPASAPAEAAPPPAADENAPPPMVDENAPPAVTTPEGENPPPAMDDPNVPAAFIPPPANRPFLTRFNAIEIGIAAASLLAGWAISAVFVLGSAVIISSMVLGRLAWDLPLLWLNVLRDPEGRTQGAQLLGGTNAGIAAGALFLGILGGAVLSGLVTYAIGLLSPDWETVMGTVVAAGLLAGAGVLALLGTVFIASLLVPVPLVWLIALGFTAVMGVVIPPVAVVAGQILGKRPRPVPGGVIGTLLNMLPLNQLNRPPAGNAQQ